MASPPPPFHVEDQTDEDFFDKLVDDEFGITGSGSVSGDMVRALSNLSIGDMGTSVEDSGDPAEAEDRQENTNILSSGPPEKESLVMEENTSLVSSVVLDNTVPSSDPVDLMAEVGSPGSSTGKSVGSKGTSVKEVQWSSFSTDTPQLDMGGFGSYTDLFSEVLNGSADKLATGPETKGSPEENPVADPSTYFHSLEQQEDQAHGVVNEHTTYPSSSEQHGVQAYGATNEQVNAGSDSQNWDNLYPGWKYDANSGQWYQVDTYNTKANSQLDGYNTSAVISQEGFQDNTQLAGDGVVSDQRSDVSYLQQTVQSVVETVAEGCMTGSVSNWNQVSQGSTDYPPNMVFDPQYPGWYYDTNTQEWYSLESYTQSIQTSTSTVQNQLTQDVGASSDGFFSERNPALCSNEVGQFGNQTLQGQASQELGGDWGGSASSYLHQNMWQPKSDDRSGPVAGVSGCHPMGNFYGLANHEQNYADQQTGSKTTEAVSNLSYIGGNDTTAFPGFVSTENIYQFSQPRIEQTQHANVSQNYYLTQNSTDYSQQSYQSGTASYSQFSYTPNGGRSSAGRPPHALVTFGFGGKLVVMKATTSFGANMAYGSQDASGGTISVLNLAEVVIEKTDASGIGSQSYDYFHTLCKQSFPGPLVGGNAATKDLNKWVDERITNCESSTNDFRKGELLRLLLSLLKISCQHYGKLRSPFGTDPLLQETDGPELDVTKLFASSRKNAAYLREYGAFTHCMHNLPSEGQIRTTAVEVQNLLVSGRRKEALQCAQEGQLWGPALVLAAQLGEKFYVATVKQMAHRQFVSGSPLRTLCLLISGQPADVFSTDSSNISLPGAVNMSQHPAQVLASGMLDDWEENLAIITANRTKDDELVIVHLGDCLWKERGEITAAHTCYLVAEANFELYSDSARLCLIGADHWKCPRTYASPEAIQRTELYEYSKVLGNSQFMLLPFQPYKLVYAYMLAEVGKVSDSLKYCQAILKSLKNSGRAPEVETWKLLVSSLEERLRTHQQGGFGTNLAPAKLVGKIFTSIDRSIHRMIGAPPPPLPPMPQSNPHAIDHDNFSVATKVASSQSTMAMSSLIPSASVETISEWTGDSRKTMHNRSISEPDFGRSPKQVNSSNDASSTGVQNKTSGAPSRFGRIGSQLFQKTMGWVSKSRPDRQAKLGERNKFYYDEKLKRWVEEGAEPPAEEAALPPPPTSSFQNGVPDYNINSAYTSQSLPANGGLETKTSNSSEHSPGIPPIPPSPNQFSARGRMGVRSRYVDTFNKGGGMSASSFQSPSAPSVKPVGGAKFFIPTPAASGGSMTDATERIQEASSNEDSSTSVVKESSFSSLTSSSSSFTMQRFPSMDNIAPMRNKGMGAALQNGNGTLPSRTRAASWSGSYPDSFNHKMANLKPLGDGLGVPSSFAPNNPSPIRPTSGSLQVNGSSFGDDLQEVEL